VRYADSNDDPPVSRSLAALRRSRTCTEARDCNQVIVALAGFPLLLAAFWFTASYFGITGKLGDHPASAVVSFAMLLAPYWFFGFGIAEPLKRFLNRPALRVAAAAVMILPYLVFTVARSEFRPMLCAELLLAILALTALLEYARGDWADYVALLSVALIIEKHVFAAAWSIPGLSGLEKFLFVDVVLYDYLVVRTSFKIGFDFRARVSDFAIGLREFAFYAPVALGLGFALGFLHFHRIAGNPAWVGASWLFTLFFVALPEEIFFRGILLQLLERKMATRAALLLSSAIFGLAHFNKRAVFNWRYVILAAIAGVFYGRSYLVNRRILSAGITHATVDTVWAIWLR
jgi:membrane protease YdiL (CAAX protease family)